MSQNYSEQAAYYQAFSTGYWASEDAASCPCHGQGYVLSEVDTWHECPVHFCGQLHPDALDGAPEGFDAQALELESMTAWAVKRGLASPLPIAVNGADEVPQLVDESFGDADIPF